jgi:hypothetical protein
VIAATDNAATATPTISGGDSEPSRREARTFTTRA